MSVGTTAASFRKATKWIGVPTLCLVFGAALALRANGQANRPITTRGLKVVEENRHQVVYEANYRVFWLADANFAASPEAAAERRRTVPKETLRRAWPPLRAR